jgi:hypothetical protein
VELPSAPAARACCAPPSTTATASTTTIRFKPLLRFIPFSLELFLRYLKNDATWTSSFI